MSTRKIMVIGGGAAGFFAAIRAAEMSPDSEVSLFEKSAQILAKVRISGGGRCNVTHACFDPRELTKNYPRGSRTLIGAFHRFQPQDTVEWFESRGVRLKTEADGRMFPVSDSSLTIIECLTNAAREAGVKVRTSCGMKTFSKNADGAFSVEFANSERHAADRLLLATGGCRTTAQGEAIVAVGHSLEPPVPSLFTFHIETPWLRELAGTTVEMAEVQLPEIGLRERTALLVTHWGLSGPATLRLSAWGARKLHALDYQTSLTVNWLPHLTSEMLAAEMESRRAEHGARLVVNTPVAPLTARLWEQLVLASGVSREDRWSSLRKDSQENLARQLQRCEFAVSGKSLNKEEFVTCGGVRLSEVDFRTMESRICPGLYFAGELLDVDGVTGGFNFQAAWTTGWIAGGAAAAPSF